MSYQVMARKYRPQKFGEVVGQDHITATLQNAISLKRIHHAYLFAGIRGVGKTTLARIFAKALNCEKGPAREPCNECVLCKEITLTSSMDVQEIDGASNTGVDDVREIREHVKYMPAHGRYKIYIIDEVHMLSTSAFNALLKTLEEPPAHVIFIFATTEPHKLPATILSRCQRYDFKRIAVPKIAETLSDIAKTEEIEVDEGCFDAIAREADGSMRDAESLLDQAAAYAGKKITNKHLKELLGFMDKGLLADVLRAIVEKDGKVALESLGELFEIGANLQRFALELLDKFRSLMLLKTAGGVPDLVREELEALEPLAKKASTEECLMWFEIAYRGAEDVARSRFPRIVLEALIVKLCTVRPVQAVDELLARVEELKAVSIQQPVTSYQLPVVSEQGSGDVVLEREMEGRGEGDFLSWIRTSKPQMASILDHALEFKVTDSTILLIFPERSLYGDMLKESDRKATFENLAKDFFRQPMNLVCQFKQVSKNDDASNREELVKKRKELKEDALNHRTVKAAVNIFGAEIREIKTKDEG